MTDRIDHRRVRRSGSLLSTMAAAGLLLSGCSGGGLNMFNDLDRQYGDRTDVCYAARKPLIDTGNVFAESMITGAAIGAATGAATGAAADRSNRGQGAVWGAVTGFLVGLTAGYLDAKQKQAKNQAELLASIDADASRDNQKLAASNSAIGQLTRCRQTQVEGVERQYRSHAVTAAQAKAQLQQIQSSIHQDNELISDVLGRSVDRAKVYIKARGDAGGPVSNASAHHASPAQPGQYVATGNINVRGSPSTNAPVVGHLSRGEAVDVGSDDGSGWLSVTVNGSQGYVSKSLLVSASSPGATKLQTASVSSGGNGTASFAQTNEQAQQSQQVHQQQEKSVDTKINDLSAIVGWNPGAEPA